MLGIRNYEIYWFSQFQLIMTKHKHFMPFFPLHSFPLRDIFPNGIWIIKHSTAYYTVLTECYLTADFVQISSLSYFSPLSSLLRACAPHSSCGDSPFIHVVLKG